MKTDVTLESTTAPGNDAIATGSTSGSVRTQALLWYWQRLSAMVLAIWVVIHLIGIIYAVRGGLSAADVLGRTRGNWAFGAFYATFVVACAIHAPIGLANIIAELRGGRGTVHVIAAQLFAAL